MIQLEGKKATINFNQMKKITLRQNLILESIRKNGKASNREILAYLQEKLGDLNRATIVREIDYLLEAKLILKEGAGRSVVYREKIANSMLSYFDAQAYFETESDKRTIAFSGFNFQVFQNFSKNFFSLEELKDLDEKNNEYRKNIKSLSETILKKELERLTIEFSWKSSQIEGNTYSLLDTEFLIKENREAQGRTKEEAQMILNHKEALDYILKNKADFKKMSLAKIENVHKILVKKMNVKENIRQKAVGITGTKFRPIDNQFQIEEALGKMMEIINNEKTHSLVKALSSVLLISYIQPFEDGNKRTARLIGNAILLANDYCPLSYRSVDEKDYKKAMLLFYEQNSALFFKQLFVEQFEFSISSYFLV